MKIELVRMCSTSRPREENEVLVHGPVAKKRSRRNEAEKLRNAKMDNTIQLIKTEIEADETTTKADTLSLALESLRQLKEQNLKLQQQLYGHTTEPHTTGIDADAALLFCLAQNAGQHIQAQPLGARVSHATGQAVSEMGQPYLRTDFTPSPSPFKPCNPQTGQ